MNSILTWESDIEAFVAHGEIRYEAELHAEIPKQARFYTRGQHWAGEPSNRNLEIAVLNDGKVIVILLQMERVEHQMDTWKSTGGWQIMEWREREFETQS